MVDILGAVALVLVIIVILILIFAAIFYFLDRSSISIYKVTNITSTNTSDTYTTIGNNVYVYTAAPGTGSTYTMNFSNASGSTGQFLYISNGSSGSNNITTTGLGLPTTQSGQGSNNISQNTTAVYVVTGNSTVTYLGAIPFT